MGIFTVTGSDTLTIQGNVFTDQAYGTVTTVELPNELVNMKTGKNGNTVIAQNAAGFNGMVTMRVARGSSDDQFMNGLVPQSAANFPATQLLAGSFVKSMGDGQGNVLYDTYTLAGGMISKIPAGQENVEGDTEQGVVTYNIKFANVSRVIS